MPGGAKKNFEEITLKGGAPTKLGTPDVRVLIRDQLGRPIVVSGTVKPTDNDNGYAPGCIFIKTGITTGATGSVMINAGTYADCNFNTLFGDHS